MIAPIAATGIFNTALQAGANAAKQSNNRRPTAPSTPRNPFQIPTQPTLPSMPTTVPTPTVGVAPIGTPGKTGEIYIGGGMMGDPFYYSRSPEEQSYISAVLRANPGKRVPDLFNNGQYIGPSGNPPANGGGQPRPHVDPDFPVPGDPNYSGSLPQPHFDPPFGIVPHPDNPNYLIDTRPGVPSFPIPITGQDPYAPIDQLPTFNPNPTQPGTGGGGGQTPGGGQAGGPFDYNTIDHADIPGVLKERGQIGLPGYQQLVDFGHTEENLRKVFQGLPDVSRTPELNAYMRDNALGILNTKGPFNLRTMDHENLPDVLKQQGTLTQAGYNQLVEHGHPETLLRMTIRDAGIDVGDNLANYIDKNPMGIIAKRDFEREPVDPYLQEGLASGGIGWEGAKAPAQLDAAFEAAPFAFEDNKMLKRGYSFKPFEGGVLVASAPYEETEHYFGGVMNVYGPANPQTLKGIGGPIDQTGNNPFGETPSTPVTPVDPGPVTPVAPVNPGPVTPVAPVGPVNPGTPGVVNPVGPAPTGPDGSYQPIPGQGAYSNQMAQLLNLLTIGQNNNSNQIASVLNTITDLSTANPFADLPPYVAPPAPVYNAPTFESPTYQFTAPDINVAAPAAPAAPNITLNMPDPAAQPSFQMFGAQATSVPGVKIKRSLAQRQLMTQLGTGYFNRATRPTLRISNLNV